MGKRKFSRLMPLLVVLLLLVAAVGGAAVKTYTGVGKCAMGDLVTPQQAKNYAKEKAMMNAREQAGVYLRTYTSTTNAKLSDNEITAITNTITALSGEVKYTQTPGEVDGQPVVVYTATLEAKVDTDGISRWLSRGEADKVMIIRQDETAQKDKKDNLEKVEQLNRQYNKASSAQEKENIRQERSWTHLRNTTAQNFIQTYGGLLSMMK